MRTALHLDQLQKDVAYTYDYDAVIINTEKYDATFNYEKQRGYTPGVSFIGKIPVGIEARNGNSSPAFRIKETVIDNLSQLKQHGITIDKVRMDAASYKKEVLAALHTGGYKFYIRAAKNKVFNDIKVLNWTPTTIAGEDSDVASLPYSFRKDSVLENSSNTPYRIVISRFTSFEMKSENKFTDDKYMYRAIITNDWDMTEKEVVEFYNQRGAIEKNFDELGNDFNWKRIPFSFLEENAVFLHISAIAKVIYQYIITRFSKKVSFLKPTFRLKKFITHFINVVVNSYLGGLTGSSGSIPRRISLRCLNRSGTASKYP